MKYILVLFFMVGYTYNYSQVASIEKRMAEDAKQGKPLIAYVTVALCDNFYQGIVPVGNGLCDGSKPRKNLYWGALYGVKTYFSKHANWKRVNIKKPNNTKILERVAFTRQLTYKNNQVSVYLIADAWQGKYIKQATTSYLASFSDKKHFNIKNNSLNDVIPHVNVYIGHNGLMDFNIKAIEDNKNNTATSAIILACKSDAYFSKYLQKVKTHKLLTTSSFMAPEAYTLEAAISSWFSGRNVKNTHLSASKAYSQYQKAKLSWCKKLFIFDEQ